MYCSPQAMWVVPESWVWLYIEENSQEHINPRHTVCIKGSRLRRFAVCAKKIAAPSFLPSFLPSISYLLPPSSRQPPPRQRSARRKNGAVVWNFHDLQIVILLAIAIIKIHMRELQQTCWLNENLTDSHINTPTDVTLLHISPIEFDACNTRLDSLKLRHYDVSSPQVSPPLKGSFQQRWQQLENCTQGGKGEGGILHALLRNSTTARARKGSAAHSWIT